VVFQVEKWSVALFIWYLLASVALLTAQKSR